jgi:hypothetical protein
MTCRAVTAPGICFKALITNGKNMTNSNEVGERREAPLRTPSLLGAEDVRNITAELNVLPADVFALYIRTKNFHWLSAVLIFAIIT